MRRGGDDALGQVRGQGRQGEVGELGGKRVCQGGSGGGGQRTSNSTRRGVLNTANNKKLRCPRGEERGPPDFEKT